MIKERQMKLVQPVEESKKPDLLTVREVADRLRVDETTVRRWIKQGLLEAITLPHVGKRQGYRVRAAVVEVLVNGTQE